MMYRDRIRCTGLTIENYKFHCRHRGESWSKQIEITAISRRNISRSPSIEGREGGGGVIISANYIVQKRKIIMYFNELT